MHCNSSGRNGDKGEMVYCGSPAGSSFFFLGGGEIWHFISEHFNDQLECILSAHLM